MRVLAPIPAALVVLVACSAPQSPPTEEEPPPTAEEAPVPTPPAEGARPAPAQRELPATWTSASPLAFERLVDSLAAEGGELRWSAPALETLAAALRRQDEVAVRAAVLVAHSADRSATEVLLARLEERAVAPNRGLDAGDIVAAGALAQRTLEADDARRLEALVVGDEPHPDLEVRVECARAALGAGRDAVIPFLLTVLRALTPAEREHPADWERVTTLAWAKSRAAQALSLRAGVECVFRPDGSWEEQMAEAERLEGLLR